MVVLGVLPEREMKVGGYLKDAEFADNNPPNDNDTGWIVIGDGVSRLLSLKIGDNISIGSPPNNLTLKVIGSFKTGGFADFFGIASIIDIAKVDKFRDFKNTVSSYVVRLKDPRYAGRFKDYIKRKYSNIDLIMEKDLINRASFILSNVEKFVLLVSGLALLIGILGVSNTVFMNVSERRKEIGILKATGWNNLEIITEVMFESLIIGIMGTVMGIILGIVGVFLAVDYFNITIRILITVNDILKPLIAGFLISVIAGLPPAWRAMNISPIESLRE
jgi:ABC-type antimicrobial peptide transport system permease subunit